VKKAVDETKGKEKTTIHQNRTLVAGHMKGGRNPGHPDFLSRYKSQANRSLGLLYVAQDSCLDGWCRSRPLLRSWTKLEGEGKVDS